MFRLVLGVELGVVCHVQEASECLWLVIEEDGDDQVWDADPRIIKRVIQIDALDVDEVRVSEWGCGRHLRAGGEVFRIFHRGERDSQASE